MATVEVRKLYTLKLSDVEFSDLVEVLYFFTKEFGPDNEFVQNIQPIFHLMEKA